LIRSEQECSRVLRYGGELRVELGSGRFTMANVPKEGNIQVDSYGMVDLRLLPVGEWPSAAMTSPPSTNNDNTTNNSMDTLPYGTVSLLEWLMHTSSRCQHVTEWDDGTSSLTPSCTCAKQPYVSGTPIMLK
jgi:hypothetical protein